MSTPHATVLIVGAGPVGLCNARTLLQDGFDVTIVTRDAKVGGLWTHTFPDLATNSPWGSFTFSGLDMPKPDELDGTYVPARIYQAYLEEFYDTFVRPQARLLTNTAVISLEPLERGWKAVLRLKDGQPVEERFDKVVLATGSLGRPRIPKGLSGSSLPVFHSNDLSAARVDHILSTIPPSGRDELPSMEGDADTVVVVGTGKSAIDAAVLFTRKGRKVVMVGRSFKWMSAPVKPDFIPSELMTAIMGPNRVLDNWFQRFVHTTRVGSWLFSLVLRRITKTYTSSYGGKIQPPRTSIHLDMPRFSVGLTPEFRRMVDDGRIALIVGSSVVGSDDKGVALENREGVVAKVTCRAVVAATGFEGNGRPFLRAELQEQLRLTRRRMREGWRARVRDIRRGWTTFMPTGPIRDEEMDMPTVYRGIVPLGRWREKGLVIAGGSTMAFKPAIMYETEAHWISSFFMDDPQLLLPTYDDAVETCHAENEHLRARYPDVDPYYLFPDGTHSSGFSELTRSRRLLMDLQLDPWRAQRGRWYNPLGWLGIRVQAEDYKDVGVERRLRREAGEAQG